MNVTMTREQAAVALGAIIMRRRLVEQFPDLCVPAGVDPHRLAATLTSAETTLRVALERRNSDPSVPNIIRRPW